ncbi:hypothetical protein SLE2022_178150 [Rubroshorea leprosula]
MEVKEEEYNRSDLVDGGEIGDAAIGNYVVEKRLDEFPILQKSASTEQSPFCRACSLLCLLQPPFLPAEFRLCSSLPAILLQSREEERNNFELGEGDEPSKCFPPLV